MLQVQRGPLAGLLLGVTLLGGLAVTVGLQAPGWTVGAGSLVVTGAVLGLGLARGGQAGLGPANRVTLTRATLVAGVAALTADSFLRPAPVGTLVALTSTALALDWVDGQVARRTHTVTRLGARFDMEVDAFLILVLSVYVAPALGAWVLLIGAARYLLLVAGWVMPWLRRASPARRWSKVVAAVQGVVLAVAAADLLPHAVVVVVLLVALGLLAESFGRQVAWLQRHGYGDRAGPRRTQEVAV